MQESFWWWQCSDSYVISFPHLHTPSPPPPPPPPFSPSIISLTVFVDVKHHVYLLPLRLPWDKGVCVFSCRLTYHLLIWQSDRAWSFTCYCGNVWGNECRNKSAHTNSHTKKKERVKKNWRQKFHRQSVLLGIESATRPRSVTSPALYLRAQTPSTGLRHPRRKVPESDARS